MKISEEIDCKLIRNRIKIVYFDIVQHKIVHNDLNISNTYINKQSFLEVLLLNLKFNP
jgi:hypothetical protein